MVFIAIFTRFKSNLKLLGALLGKVKEVSQPAHEKGWRVIENPQLYPNLTEYCYITLEEYFVLHRYDLEKGTEFLLQNHLICLLPVKCSRGAGLISQVLRMQLGGPMSLTNPQNTARSMDFI